MLDFVIESLQKGGWVLFPIFTASVAGWVLVMGALFRLQGLALPGRWLRKLEKEPAQVEAWAQKYGRRYKNTVAGGILVRLAELPPGTDQEHMENILDEVMRHKIPELDKGLSYISVIASMAPLLGLLGTVSGMIGTFRIIGSFGTSNPALMADSIAEALLTTQDGLVVAFPLMIIHLFLYNRAIKIENRSHDVAFRYILHRNRSGSLEATP
jgi:biopolymer transport protein ExbB